MRRCLSSGCTMPSYAITDSGFCSRCMQQRREGRSERSVHSSQFPAYCAAHLRIGQSYRHSVEERASNSSERSPLRFLKNGSSTTSGQSADASFSHKFLQLQDERRQRKSQSLPRTLPAERENGHKKEQRGGSVSFHRGLSEHSVKTCRSKVRFPFSLVSLFSFSSMTCLALAISSNLRTVQARTGLRKRMAFARRK